MNCIQLIGRAGRDPEGKHFQNGKYMAKVSLAVERRVGNQEAEGEGTTDWVDLQAWGKTAELLERYIRKGDRFGVSGSVRQEKWQDQNGSNREKLIVVIDRLTFLESKKDGGATPSGGRMAERQPAGARVGAHGQADDAIISDEEMPF